jgi:hypothetical protein
MDWLIPIGVVGAIVGLVFARRLIALWIREPIGLGVPLAVIAIVTIAPQMPDMMAGLTEAVGSDGKDLEDWRGALSIPLCGAALGFFGWYWTRAAVNAPYQVDDCAAHPLKNRGVAPVTLPRHVKILPRAALVLAALSRHPRSSSSGCPRKERFLGLFFGPYSSASL